MFRSLYGKIMALFLAVLVLSISLLTALLYRSIRNDKIEARLDMLVAQANDVAYLAARIDNRQTGEYLSRKVMDIMSEYDAFVIILDANGKMISIGDETVELVYEYSVSQTMVLLSAIVNGMEIRHRSEMADTGNPIFTVGVPYKEGGEVMGGVFIHTSEQSIEASYRDVLSSVLHAMMLALALASLIILVVCEFITRPLREMAQAAERFAHGDFQQRVHVKSRDEVGRLADSFNSMAADLDRLEQTRREFVANVSHELRSPLTSMQGFINGVLDGTVPEAEQSKYLGVVLDETKRLNKLITTLLDLSHMESGQTPLQKSKFDINELIARALIRQEGHISEKNMDVWVEFDEDTCMVNADVDRIEQVMINLIDNAVKYAGESGVITLSTRREKGIVRVAVEDNGPGIAQEDILCIFDRFYMADKAHTTGTGTGLGLPIVKSILDQHGQNIVALSEMGKGTRFEFTLEGA